MSTVVERLEQIAEEARLAALAAPGGGATGSTGSTGATGTTGATGAVGATGSAGEGALGAVRWMGPCKTNGFAGQYMSAGFGDIDGGTFTLTINGQTTSAIPYTANAAAIRSALEALPSIGAGNVMVQPTNDSPTATINDESFTFIFKELVATSYLTANASLLTGASAPYELAPIGTEAWGIPLITLAAGDIVEDFMHHVPQAFDGEVDPYLLYTDHPDNPAASNAWTNPSAAQGVPSPDGIDLTVTTSDYTNFTGYGSSGVTTQPTSLLVLLATWAKAAAEAGTEFYGNLPAAAVNPVTIYAYLKQISETVGTGEVWIWVKVATPAPMED